MRHTLACGKMICNKVRVLKYGQMVLSTKENITKEKRMEKENSLGVMDRVTKVLSTPTTSKDMACIYGKMGRNIQGIGYAIDEKAKVCLNGLMGDATMVVLKMTKKKV